MAADMNFAQDRIVLEQQAEKFAALAPEWLRHITLNTDYPCNPPQLAGNLP